MRLQIAELAGDDIDADCAGEGQAYADRSMRAEMITPNKLRATA